MGRAAAAWLLVTLAATNPGPPSRDVGREVIERVVVVVGVQSDQRTPARVEQQRAELRRLMDDVVDFPEMARRALGRHWMGRSPAERREFMDVFRATLEDACLARLQGYAGQSIEYVGRAIEGGRATIRSRIVNETGNTGVDYRLRFDEGRWRVVDVVVDGLSVVTMYRAQVDRLIQSDSHASLLERLRGEPLAISLPGAAPPR